MARARPAAAPANAGRSSRSRRSPSGTATRPVYLHLLRNGGEPAAARAAAGQPTRLTRRQLEVLSLIDQGLPAKAIANRLEIAEPTVRNHIRSILLELGCHSQLEALAVARRRGLL